MLPFSEPPTSKTEVKNEFEFNTLPTLPGNNGLDLGNMNMSDFAAMMANNGFDYSTIPQTTTQNNNQPTPSMSMQMSTNAAPNNREQSDTDRLLAQLGAFTGPDTTQNQPQQSTTVVNNDEVDALLASLNDGNVGGDYSNFDFGDIDLGSLGDMSGLFGTTTIPDVPSAQPQSQSQMQQQSGGQQAISLNANTNANSNTNMPNTNTLLNTNTMPSSNPMVPNTQPQVSSQPQPQPQQQSQSQPQPQLQVQPQQQQPQAQTQPIPAPVKQEPPNPTTTVPAADPNLDMSHVFDDSQAIDLDDFNFGDGDGEEGGIDLTGDEFENLLAAFN